MNAQMGEKLRMSTGLKWPWMALQEAIDVRDGTHDTPAYVADGIPLVTSKNFDNDGDRLLEYGYDSEDRISQEAVRNGTKLLPKGAVVFVVRGMSLANEFRVGVTVREVAFNQDLRAIVPKSDMDGR